jgi:hypothetical protein
MTIDRELVRKWIRKKPSALAQAGGYLAYHWYHTLPRLVPSITSVSSLVLYLAVLAVLVAIASVPIWHKVFSSSGLNLEAIEVKDGWQIGVVVPSRIVLEFADAASGGMMLSDHAARSMI